MDIRKVLTILIGVIGIGGLAQCGAGNSNSAHVKLKILNQQPVVINAPINISTPPPPGSVAGTLPTITVVPANWFLYQIEVDNNSTETLTVVNTTLTLTGTDDNGVTSTTTSSLDVNASCIPVANATVSTRAYLAILAPGGKYTHLADPSGCDPSTATYGLPYDSWYIQSLPTGVTNWQVSIEGQGWFADVTTQEPNERLTMTGEFVTQ